MRARCMARILWVRRLERNGPAPIVRGVASPEAGSHWRAARNRSDIPARAGWSILRGPLIYDSTRKQVGKPWIRSSVMD